MIQRVQPQGPEAVQVDLLDILGGGLHDHLVLIIMLEAVGIFSVTPVCRPPGGLYIRHVPGLRPQGPEQSMRIEGSGPHLDVVGLGHDAAPLCEEALQSHQYVLKIHA
jgi:hypothetical protein